MSKSKKNIVGLYAITEGYGADTARLFMMSDSPPDRDLEWTDAGIDGAWRYLNRLWKMFLGLGHVISATAPVSQAHSDAGLALRKVTHKAVADVSRHIEQFHFNKAVARIRELSNAVDEAAKDKSNPALREACDALLRMLEPFIPHFAEEVWHMLGHKQTLLATAWPKADPALCADDEVTIVVQINGKLRTTFQVAAGTDKAALESLALAQKNVQDSLQGKEIKKIIVVPGKIVNVVAA
jgi:leucyl-tRNA synthetase